jgi:hypothetical protein
VQFDAAIDPTAATHYITLKLWGAGCGHFGNETCITQLHHPQLLKRTMSIADFQASQLAPSQEGHASASNPNPCTVDFSSAGGSDTTKYNGPAPGIFQYSTYILPKVLTATGEVRRTGKLTLAIGSGTYQTYGPPSLVRSRTLYKAYVHSGDSGGGGAFLSLEGAAGTPPPPAPPLPAENSTVTAAVTHLQGEILTALTEVAKWQEWGPDFEQAVKKSQSFALFRGAPTAGSCRGPRNASGFPQMTGYQYCIDRKNLAPMRQLEVYAMAWKSSGSWAAGWSRNQSVLDRIAAGLDFFAVAQGANGGFNCADGCFNFTDGRGCSCGIPGLVDEGYYCNTVGQQIQPASWNLTSHDFWLGGGPGGRKRRNASQELEGYGHVGLAQALVLTGNAMDAAGMFEHLVDDDGDPSTPKILRRSAYERLMIMSRDYQASVFWTWCPNQWFVDVRALYAANRALSMLNSSSVWPPSMMQTIICSSIGNDAGTCPMPFPYSPMPWTPDGKAWDRRKEADDYVLTSPAGISMEAHGNYSGSYSNGYGDILDSVADLARYSDGDPDIQSFVHERMNRVSDTFSYFRMRNVQRHSMHNEGPISHRHNENPAEDRMAIGGSVYAAVHLGNAAGKRISKIYLEQQQAFQFSAKSIATRRDVSPLIDAIAAVELLGKLNETMLASDDHGDLGSPTNYFLPNEVETRDYVFADATAHNLALKVVGWGTLFASLQWRHDNQHFAGSTADGPFFPSPSFGGLTRLHTIEINPHLERIANIATDAPEGFRGVNSFEFGPFLVAMNFNHSVGKQFMVPSKLVGKSVVELVANTSHNGLPVALSLAPAQTMVLHMSTLQAFKTDDTVATAQPTAADLCDWRSERLPTTITPTHYNLTLRPMPDAGLFTGTVAIDARASASARCVVLHTGPNLTVSSMTVNGAAVASSRRNATSEMLTLELAHEIPMGGALVLRFAFSGHLHSSLGQSYPANRGFYRIPINDSTTGRPSWMAISELWAVEARTEFVCFDEPALKATFSVSLEVPASTPQESMTSNMPLAGCTLLEVDTQMIGGATAAALQRCTFQTSPPMSTCECLSFLDLYMLYNCCYA